MHLLLLKLLVSPHSLGSEYWAIAKIINQVSKLSFFYICNLIFSVFVSSMYFFAEQLRMYSNVFCEHGFYLKAGMEWKIARRSLRSCIAMLHFLRTASAVKQQTELTESNWNGRCWGVERMFRRFGQWNEINDPFSW